MATLPGDFSSIFGSTATGGLTPIPPVDYAKGWEYVGANPPTKNDFSYLQNTSDQKAKWLYDYLVLSSNAASRKVGNAASNIPDMSFFAGLNSVNGYQKFPNGTIVQWGQNALPVPGTSITINYPIAFPNAVSCVLATMNATSANSGIGPCAATAVNTTSFAFTMFNGASFGSSVLSYWLAVGR